MWGFCNYNYAGTGLCTDGSIQLVGGANNLQGRVEVCNVGAWGTVCDDSFGTNDAQVVCRQLGYSSEGIYTCNINFNLVRPTIEL